MLQNDPMKQPKIRRLRTALINWYPFPEGERALLLGENVEPLLPLLERRYRRVDMIPTDSADAGILKQGLSAPCGVYDCIVAADLVEITKDVPALLRQI